MHHMLIWYESYKKRTLNKMKILSIPQSKYLEYNFYYFIFIKINNIRYSSWCLWKETYWQVFSFSFISPSPQVHNYKNFLTRNLKLYRIWEYMQKKKKCSFWKLNMWHSIDEMTILTLFMKLSSKGQWLIYGGVLQLSRK